ncbi:MAG: dimethylamine corrinoid protein 3 [Methanosarcinaceae archaeon]|nr:dimethylamine corrinoid protein 3 [Methanosarcinaceae archaeon]
MENKNDGKIKEFKEVGKIERVEEAGKVEEVVKTEGIEEVGEILKISETIYKCDKDLIEKSIIDARNKGIDDKYIIKGISIGLSKISDSISDDELFMPQAGVATKVVDSLMDEFGKDAFENNGKTIIIGTVEGDVHEIGKTLLSILFKTSGFKVYDLGTDVSKEEFIEAVKKYDADLLSLSALMTTTMNMQKEIIEELKEKSLRDKLLVMVGGAPVTKEWAKEIGADLYAEDATGAVKIAKEALGVK